jgi:predicted short-subunit dehydrogenase-like oxidoreductase (DUF2520 family)
MTRPRRPETVVVGAGRLAGAVVPGLVEAGYPIVAVASRRLAGARGLVRRAGGARATTQIEEAAGEGRLVLLAVPDRAIAGLAKRLADAVGVWRGRTVIHHAGALGIEPLAPLARAGAGTAVVHPLQCLGTDAADTGVLEGSHARVEGDRRGRPVARRLALDLGLVPLPLPATLGAADRAAYHTAASLVSNDVVALLSAATEILMSLGLSRRRALEALYPLASGTLAQARAGGVEGALTGPVARGDSETITRHLRAVRKRSRDVAEAHRALSRVLADLGHRVGMLSARQRRDLRRRLDEDWSG